MFSALPLSDTFVPSRKRTSDNWGWQDLHAGSYHKEICPCFKSHLWFVTGGFLFSRPSYNVVCSSCDPAAHRPCHLVLCPSRWGHLVSHMEGTGRTPQLAASPLKHSFCLRVSHWMDHCPAAKRDRDKIFSVSILVMFNQPLRQIYEV